MQQATEHRVHVDQANQSVTRYSYKDCRKQDDQEGQDMQEETNILQDIAGQLKDLQQQGFPSSRADDSLNWGQAYLLNAALEIKDGYRLTDYGMKNLADGIVYVLDAVLEYDAAGRTIAAERLKTIAAKLQGTQQAQQQIREDDQEGADMQDFTPGTIISGTLRMVDLMPAYFKALEKIAPATAQIRLTGTSGDIFKMALNGTLEDYLDSETDETITLGNGHSYFVDRKEDRMTYAWQALETLEDDLNSNCPDGYYFGANIGDGSDFGFWPLDDEDPDPDDEMRMSSDVTPGNTPDEDDQEGADMQQATRQDYLNGKVSHQDYYGQYVDEIVKRDVLWTISKDKILSSEDDDSFNDIPLRYWDSLPAWSIVAAKMRKRGDFLTPAGLVCVAKEAARQIKAEAEAAQVDEVIAQVDSGSWLRFDADDDFSYRVFKTASGYQVVYPYGNSDQTIDRDTLALMVRHLDNEDLTVISPS